MPVVALIGIAAAPILYYLVMAFIAILPGVPPQSHDHLLHQFGMPVLALLSYLVGLAISLGSEMRTTISWLKPRKV